MIMLRGSCDCAFVMMSDAVRTMGDGVGVEDGAAEGAGVWAHAGI